MGCEHSISKWQDEVTHVLDTMSMMGWEDESVGSSEDIGYHCLFRGPVIEGDRSIGDIRRSLSDDNDAFDSLTVDDLVSLATCAGAVLEYHESGAVYSTIYRNTSEMLEVWTDLITAEARILHTLDELCNDPDCDVCGEDCDHA